MRESNNFVVRHAHGLCQFAEDIPGGGARTAEDVHVEVYVNIVCSVIGMTQFLTQAIHPQFTADLPHRVEVRAAVAIATYDLGTLQHTAFTDFDQVGYRKIRMCAVGFGFPVTAASDPLVVSQVVEWPGVPVRIGADHADLAGAALRNRLGNGITAAR